MAFYSLAPDRMLLSAKSALVTGAANRLGAKIARTLHQNGANLIIHYRQSELAAQALVTELNHQRHDSAIAIAANLAEPEQLESLAQHACDFHDRLDILVNNASSFYPTRLGNITLQAWDDLLASNYRAPLFLSQACLPALRRSGGCIINLIDIYAQKPLLHHSVYCSAKAANQMLVKSLALELAPEIRVNGIAPGAILWPDNSSAQEHDDMLQQIPLARCGTPQAIADTTVFLAANDYITGEIIAVDGGRRLK